jgi:hypothetical protein
VAAFASDFHFLVETARREVSALRDAIGQAPPSPDVRGAQFHSAIDAFLSAISEGVDDRQASFAAAGDDIERESLVRAIQQLCMQIRGAHMTTPWIDSAQSPDLALGVTYLFDEMARAIVRGTPDVVAAASPDYMYSTLHKPFREQLGALGHSYPTNAMPIIVQYPAREVDSVFLHLIVAHELGHSAVEEHQLLEAVATAHPDPDLTKKLGQAANERAAQAGESQAQATTWISACMAQWLEEVICDALALCYVGPSFLFTAAAFGIPFGGSVSDTHPPHSLRTKLLLGYANAWGWRGIIEQPLPKIVTWLDSTAASPPDVGHETYFSILLGILEDFAPTVQHAVEAHLGGARFDRTRYDDQIDEVMELLRSKILPAQLLDGRSVDRRVALLAGWLLAFESEGDEPHALPSVLASRDLQAFLIHSLEMSTVLDEWRLLP